MDARLELNGNIISLDFAVTRDRWDGWGFGWIYTYCVDKIAESAKQVDAGGGVEEISDEDVMVIAGVCFVILCE